MEAGRTDVAPALLVYKLCSQALSPSRGEGLAYKLAAGEQPAQRAQSIGTEKHGARRRSSGASSGGEKTWLKVGLEEKAGDFLELAPASISSPWGLCPWAVRSHFRVVGRGMTFPGSSYFWKKKPTIVLITMMLGWCPLHLRIMPSANKCLINVC